MEKLPNPKYESLFEQLRLTTGAVALEYWEAARLRFAELNVEIKNLCREMRFQNAAGQLELDEQITRVIYTLNEQLLRANRLPGKGMRRYQGDAHFLLLVEEVMAITAEVLSYGAAGIYAPPEPWVKKIEFTEVAELLDLHHGAPLTIPQVELFSWSELLGKLPRDQEALQMYMRSPVKRAELLKLLYWTYVVGNSYGYDPSGIEGLDDRLEE